MATRRAVRLSSLLRQFQKVAAAPSRQLVTPAQHRFLPATSLRNGARIAQPISVRYYSAGAQSKIWDFEQIQKLTQEPNASITIVDSREPGELKKSGHIPGAINIPITSNPDSFHITQEEFEDKFGFPRPGKDQELVFYCKAGVRSRAAAALASDAGYTSVGEYPGSWVDWEEKGGKIER